MKHRTLRWNHKDAFRCYWRIEAEELKREKGVDPDDPEYFETYWRVVIRFNSCGAFDDPETATRVIFSEHLSTQYDEPIHLREILQDWIRRVSGVALGFAAYSCAAEI